jgi:GntR family phosphonate transport system transcriptional regulator
MTAPVSPVAAAREVLSRGQGITQWRQIAEALVADIAAGRFPPGSRLPIEKDLAARFGVNRHTLRRAIEALAKQGLVRAVQGSGTYVEAAPLTYQIGERTRFSEIILAQNRQPEGRMTGSEIVLAPPHVREALGLPVGAVALNVLSRHTADDAPISHGSVYVPLPRFTGFDVHYARLGSITAAFREFGVMDYRRLSTRIGADVARHDDRIALQIALARPILTIESVNVDEEGHPIQWTMSRFAADRVRITV